MALVAKKARGIPKETYTSMNGFLGIWWLILTSIANSFGGIHTMEDKFLDPWCEQHEQNLTQGFQLFVDQL